MTESRHAEKLEMFTLHKILIPIISLSLIYNYYFTVVPTQVRVKEPQFSLLGPYNTTKIITNDIYDQLIDIKRFTFKINPKPCKSYTEGLLLVIIVASNPKNYGNRNIIRNTWGRSVSSSELVFLVGESENKTVERRIQTESFVYGDIVQGNFIDVYRNMTYKHVMGLKWVAHHCPTAKYVLKTDDDVVVHSKGLWHFLAKELSPWGAKKLITCQVLEHAEVQRSQKSKWKVSTAEYAPQYYPTYCAGWAVLYSQDVVSMLLTVAQSTPYFWIDDVLITGVIAEKIGIARTPLSSLILNRPRANMLTTLGAQYAGPFLFGPPDLNKERMSEIWRAIPA